MKPTPSRSPARNSRPTVLPLAHAKRFLAAYKQAWEKKDAELAAHLFTRDAHYWEDPFARPIVGREGVYTHWKKFTHSTDHIHFHVHHFYRDGHHHILFVFQNPRNAAQRICRRGLHGVGVHSSLSGHSHRIVTRCHSPARRRGTPSGPGALPLHPGVVRAGRFVVPGDLTR